MLLELTPADLFSREHRVEEVHDMWVERPIIRATAHSGSVLGQLYLANPTPIGPHLHQIYERFIALLVPATPQEYNVPVRKRTENFTLTLGVTLGAQTIQSRRHPRPVDVDFLQALIPRPGHSSGSVTTSTQANVSRTSRLERARTHHHEPPIP
ncbi:hypothetical protein ACFW34_26100 [Streptomyces sp. NPDC058848]|uniref:hypothetical protein n=1 Tax=unclassified Streptomyces TaxID=2593676 RepID=UPI00368FB45E